MPKSSKPAAPPVLYTVTDLCDVLRCGRAHVYRILAEGELRARRERGRTIVLASDLQQYLESRPVITFTKPPRAAGEDAPSLADRDSAPGPTEDTP